MGAGRTFLFAVVPIALLLAAVPACSWDWDSTERAANIDDGGSEEPSTDDPEAPESTGAGDRSAKEGRRDLRPRTRTPLSARRLTSVR